VFDEERHALVGAAAQSKAPRLRRVHPSQLYFKRIRHDAAWGARNLSDQLAEEIAPADETRMTCAGRPRFNER